MDSQQSKRTPMKPKNRVFCVAIKRSKLLFETEKKAENFIKFNGDEIEETTGVRPTRAYYCETCGGWHVTHLKENPESDITKNLVEKYKQEREWKKRLTAELEKKRKEVKEKIEEMLKCIEAGEKDLRKELEEYIIDSYSDKLISKMYKREALNRLNSLYM